MSGRQDAVAYLPNMSRSVIPHPHLKATDNTHNLLAVAVMPDRQNHGVGRQLVNGLKDVLAKDGGRILIVETSSLDEYEGTRAFYLGQGFVREAVIRDFYSGGEDKIVFWKRL